MKVMQVKQYHREVAFPKEQKAIEKWRHQETGYGYPVLTMYYFFTEDLLEKRKKGWVAFDDNKAVYAETKTEAIAKFNKYV